MLYKILHFFLSIIVIFGLSLLVSRDIRNIKIRFVVQLLIIEIIIAYFALHSSNGLYIIDYFAKNFQILLSFSEEGTNFVLGNMNNQNLAFFFINVLCPIIFISSLIGILQYVRILPIFIYVIGTLLSKFNGMGKLESFNAISSLLLGQSENFFIYKNVIDKIEEHRIYTMSVTAMSTVSLAIVGSYITIIEPKYVFSALILNMFSTFIVLLILNPYEIDKNEDIKIYSFHKNQNFFEMLGDYIIEGGKVVIVVAAMLIGFIALIACTNSLFYFVFGKNFQELLGYLFFPFAWILGVPYQESLKVGSIMATKLVTNEFVAMIDLKNISNILSFHSIGIISIFLVSFSNFSSIGIISGTIKSLNKKQGIIVSNYGLKLVYSSTLISMLSASVAGLVL